MAETNHTSSATNHDHEASSPNVPLNANTAPEGLSRRTLMQLATSAAAIPAVALLPTPAAGAVVDRTAWDRAVAELRCAEANLSRISPIHDAAFDAAEAMCPRRAEFFSRYDLGCYADESRGREHNLAAAWLTIVRERGIATPIQDPTQSREVTSEARRVVDEFDAWRRRRDEAHAFHRCDEIDKQWEAAVDRVYDAREALLKSDAPDESALLLKLEILTKLMDGEQDLPHVKQLQTDAQRLLNAVN